jgi:hypothetical protein
MMMMSETTVAKIGRSMKNLENMGWRLPDLALGPRCLNRLLKNAHSPH